MYNFLERLIHLILPQITDLKKQKYKNRKAKNYISLGIEDSTLFYELNNQYDLLTQTTGLDISICSKDDKLSKDNLFFSGLKIKFCILAHF